jgi:FecR protein
MLVMRTRSNNSDPRQTVYSILWLAAAIFCLWMSHATAAAQIHGGQAWVTRTAPGAILYGGGLTPSALRQGATLQPSDVIDTRGSGRVVIALSDGSQVVIFPGSRVELKNFQAGGSWRDLLKITVGRVRATINHQGKRPNPYRVYSPIASIAVRGTDFLVIVEPSGETRVLVYEGLVEVGSLVNPQKTVLVRPGRNIIVRTDGDISLVTAAPRGELNEIKSLRAGNSLNNAYYAHQENFTDLQPSRFTAFSDSHLDSLQNPAYAGEFRRSNGRFYLIPSFSPEFVTDYSYDRNASKRRPGGISSTNYTLSSQLSYFAPIGPRTVVGGGVAVTKTDLGGAQTIGQYTTQDLQMRLADDQRRGLVLPPDPPGGRHLPEGAAFTLRDAGKAKFTTTNIALMIARRLGQTERTSIGVKFDYQEDRSSLSSDTNWSTGTDFRQDKDTILGHRKGFTAGITHDFGGDKKLGVYYSYNTGPFRSQSHYTQRYEFVELKTFFPGLPESEFSDSQSRRLSEVGARFRGSVTRRLFYGVEASLLDERRRLEFQDVFIPATGESGVEIRHARTRSAAFGAGVGYALRRRTVLGIDLSAGGALENRWTEHRSPPGVESSDSFGNERSDFWSLHIGGQTDLWRNLYVGHGFIIPLILKRP